MARHRNIRALDYDEEYNDYYDEYSRSLEEEFCISPTTASQYLVNREGNFNQNDVSEINVNEENNPDNSTDLEDQDIIKSKLYSCMELIQDVVGENITEDCIIETIKKTNYDAEKALDLLLNRNTASTTNKCIENKIQTEDVNKVNFKSNLYIAFTTKNDFTNCIDFNYYNFRKYIKEYVMKSLTLNLKSIRLRDGNQSSNLSTSKNVQSKSKPVPVKSVSCLEPPRPRISNVSKIPKDTSANATTNTESPSLNIKNIKNIKQKSVPEITSLYAKNRLNSKIRLNLVFAGHVDAGKSTIIGHLLALLGMVSKKNMHKNEVESKKAGKSSFLYAWVMDETEEERSRGITIDVGQHRFETDNRIVTILDAPGHRDFIPNMIAGATKADVAILVVDATNGEFETGFNSGGQTQEHILILRSFGISQLTVAVNKLDKVNFSEERYLEILEKTKKFLKQVGFKTNNVHFIPCSGLTGDNLSKTSQFSAFKWYNGPSLIQVIDNFKPSEPSITKPFRMSIHDIFKGPTSGIFISGKVDCGYVETNQKLLIKPANEICTVKNILFDNVAHSDAFAGDLITLNIMASDGAEITVGNVLCDINMPCTLATKFEARIMIFNNVDYPIIKGFSVILYSVCLNEVSTISKLCNQVDKNTNEILKKNPRLLSKNSSAIVEFTTKRPICIEVYNNFKEFGRFIFRSGDITIGAGIVTKILR